MPNEKRVEKWVVRISPEAHSAIRTWAFQADKSISEAVENAIRLLVGPACKRQGKAK